MTRKQILLSALVLGTIGNITLAMNHGKLAREKYPTVYLVTKTCGSVIGAPTAAVATLQLYGLALDTLEVKTGRLMPSSLSSLRALTILTASSLFVGSAAGRIVSKEAWNAAWNMKNSNINEQFKYEQLEY